MADQFDIVNIVYESVEPVGAGFVLYKDRSGDGETGNHITIRTLALGEGRCVNKGIVNINVFVRRQANGMPCRPLMREAVRNVKSALREIKPPIGMYWKSRIVWSETIGEAKDGFDCTNIRFEVKTEID